MYSLPKTFFTLTLAPCILFLSTIAKETPTVTIKDGRMSGETLLSTNGKEYSAFARIPYAKPPVGDLRFEPPQPNEPWEGTLNTSTNSNVFCSQSEYGGNGMWGQEDCLYINVYTPNISGNFAVMVFIHGGAFYAGSGLFIEYGPQRLMDKEVILVTFNYRLGPLGLFAYPDQGIRGNNWLYDQIAALRWVQENIQAFGGDKTKVTIFGQSAGAGAVIYHILSPLSKGLFHGAIAQSGSALCGWGLNPNPSKMAKNLAVKLNCTTYPIEKMMACLRNKSWEEIVRKNKEFEIFIGSPTVQRPNVDGLAVPDTPISLFKKGNVNKVPVIIGTTRNEGAETVTSLRKLYPRIGEEYLKKDLPDVLPLLTYDKEIDQNLTNNIARLYFKDVDINDKSQFYPKLAEVFGDVTFGCAQRTARYLAEAVGPTYVYKFNHRGNLTFAQNEPGEDLGVSHSDELPYLFEGLFYGPSKQSENDSKMSDLILTLWTDFAKSQNPTPNPSYSKHNFSWPRYTKDNPKCLDLDLNPTESEQCEGENVDFWIKEFPFPTKYN